MNDVVTNALELLEQLVRIGAPTGREHARAAFVARWLREAGLGDPTPDDEANVFLWLGPQDQPALVIDAHLDTVFPDLEVELRKEPGRWHAPGISDNTVHVAMLMAWAKHRHQTGRPWPATLLSFSVGEESQGKLLGMKCLTRRYAGRIGQALVLDMGIHSICRQGTGTVRSQVRFQTPGGHSWSGFGKTSALTCACQWIMQIKALPLWQAGQLTWNVGRFTSDQGVTHIAPHASFEQEVRGIHNEAIEQAAQQLEDHLRQYTQSQPDLQTQIIRQEERPAGMMPQDHPLVAAVEQAHRDLGLGVHYCVAGTNANWLMHQQIPAVCIGLALGSDGHTRRESLDLSVMDAGMAKMDLLFDRLMASCSEPTDAHAQS